MRKNKKGIVKILVLFCCFFFMNVFGVYASENGLKQEEPVKKEASNSEIGNWRLKTKEAKAFYSECKTYMWSIGSGGFSSSVISMNPSIRWSAKDLGVDKVTESNYRTLFEKKFNETVNIDEVLSYIVMDLPFELYWYDKDQPTEFEFWVDIEGNGVKLSSVTAKFPVSADYQNLAEKKELRKYSLDMQKVNRARETVRKIDMEMFDYLSLPNYEGIVKIRDIICDSATYDLESDKQVPDSYGNPWQIIWALDEYPTTKVTSAGYAKAFQYLCEQLYMECYTVEGFLSDGTTVKPHTWNVFPFGGKRYLVDLANFDNPDMENSEKFFMAGTAEGSVENGYIFEQLGGLKYMYKADYVDLVGAGLLVLAKEDFDPSVIKTPVVEFAVTEDTILYTNKPAEIIPPVVTVDGVVVEDVEINYWVNELGRSVQSRALPPTFVGVYEITAIVDMDLYNRTLSKNKLILTIRPSADMLLTDVYCEQWYMPYIQFVYDNHLMTGIAGTEYEDYFYGTVRKFDPDGNITKAQVAQILYNMEGQPEITDYMASTELVDIYKDWYLDAVCWAYNEGIITGDLYTKEFSPNASVTREQLALMMYRYAEYKGYDVSERGSLEGLKNDWKVNTYALEAVKWAVGSGLISGIEVKNSAGVVTARDLAPQGNSTRAQMAAILTRFCETYDTGYTNVR